MAIGVVYRDGIGLTQCYQKAYAWFSVAAANEAPGAINERDELKKRLTDSSLILAQEMADKYFEQQKAIIS